MSHVTNVMISVDWDDRPNMEALSEWLRTEAPHRGELSATGVGYLRPITDEDSQWGGWKHPGCEVWAGTLNHADLDALRQRVGDTAWAEPNVVQLFLRDEFESFFRLWMIRDHELRQFAPLVPSEEDDGFWRDR